MMLLAQLRKFGPRLACVAVCVTMALAMAPHGHDAHDEEYTPSCAACHFLQALAGYAAPAEATAHSLTVATPLASDQEDTVLSHEPQGFVLERAPPLS
jgi:hypothetical protein